MAQGGGAGDEGGGALVACQLTLATSASRPGDTVTALLQVSCSQPEALELQEVEIEFLGVERVDTSWVLPTYRRATPPINADKRKVQRYVVQSRLQAATQGTFSDLSLRRFVVRFTLPNWLPPTFRGTAVRYLYYLQAVVKYRSPALEEDGAGAAAAAGPPGSSGSVSTRVPLQIWPAKQQQLESAALERTPSLLTPSGGAAAAAAAVTAAAAAVPDGSLLSPPIQSEDVPIKCWEIGPGTAVQDAVAHIIKLASQPVSSVGRPQSPGHFPRGGSAGAGSGLLAGTIGGGSGGDAGGGGGDSHSEISHEPEEVEMGPASGAAASVAVAGAAAQLTQQQAQLQQDEHPPPPHGSTLSSGTSSPRSSSLLMARRSSLARSSLEGSASLTAPRSPTQQPQPPHDASPFRSYALRIGDQPLVRVTLHAPLEGTLQPGATLAGTLDFGQPSLAAAAAKAAAGAAKAAAEGGQGSSSSTYVAHGPRCMQVLILLETEEIVEAPWRRPVQGGGSGAIRRVYDEHLELTADTACTHFLCTIPPDGAASFQTPLLQLRWLLRFQFTASSPPPAAAAAAAGGTAEAAPADWSPLQGRLEQLSWVLPITVLPMAA